MLCMDFINFDIGCRINQEDDNDKVRNKKFYSHHHNVCLHIQQINTINIAHWPVSSAELSWLQGLCCQLTRALQTIIHVRCFLVPIFCIEFILEVF